MTSNDQAKVPVFQTYMNPILDALRSKGSPATIAELDALVLRRMAIGPEILAVPHKPDQPGRSEVSCRIAWARTYLKKAALIENPERGLWAVTEKGAAIGTVNEYELASEIQATEPDEAEGTSMAPSGTPQEDEPPYVVDLLARELRQVHDQLRAQGTLLSDADLAGCYRRFRDRFGPKAISGLDGERLLLAMHERRTHDSLVYWLEFKMTRSYQRDSVPSLAAARSSSASIRASRTATG